MPEVVNTSALTVEDETAEIEDNRPVMIDVDHVSMSFNMASEQLNNLKEYAIAIARGKLFFEEFKALDDVSFKVRKGDVFGIMGTNGSGKSTILKIIAGVLEPTKGKCTVNGNIAPLIELGAGFDMDLSARENIYLNGALLGYSKQFIDEHFQEIVEFAEVEKFLDMPLKNYSSGMVARIAFAIATVIVPEILVVDEVLSVGDFMFQKKCEDRITQLIEEYGVTVLIVSHSNDQIARLCNKAVWIEKGHVRLQGEAKTVASIYGTLGGRTGSKEAEQSVFEAMKKSEKLIIDENASISFRGENAIGSCVKAVMYAWDDVRVDSLVLVADNTHANAAIANGLAGALEAPVLPIGESSEPADAVVYAIRRLEPKHIIILDASGVAEASVSFLSRLPWRPAIDYFGGQSVLDLSLNVFRYGAKRQVWSTEAYVVTFDRNSESIALGPLAYAKKTPIFVIASEDEALQLSAAIAGLGCIRKMVLVGFTTEEGAGAFVDVFDVDVSLCKAEDSSKICSELARSEIAYFDRPGEALAFILFGTVSSSQWPQLLSAGCVGGRLRAPLYLVDDTNLDSESKALCCLNSLHGCAIKLLFIGDGAGLRDSEKRLFISSVQ